MQLTLAFQQWHDLLVLPTATQQIPALGNRTQPINTAMLSLAKGSSARKSPASRSLSTHDKSWAPAETAYRTADPRSGFTCSCFWIARMRLTPVMGGSNNVFNRSLSAVIYALHANWILDQGFVVPGWRFVHQGMTDNNS